MSESQTFIVLLALLYLSSCIKARQPGTLGITKKWFKGWAFSPPLATLDGIKKAIYLTPLLPWPKSLIISAPPADTKTPARTYSRSSAIRLVTLLHRTTAQLRFSSLLIFLLLFIAIPLTYRLEGDTIRLRLIIAYTGILLLWTTILVYCVHRRLLPKQRSDRFKNVFISLIMPWQTMRAADEIILHSHLSSIPPLLLASIATDSAGRSFLAQSYRNALHLHTPLFNIAEIKSVLKSSNINPDSLTTPPTKNDPQAALYCPCCQTEFTPPAKECEECQNLPLAHF